MSLLGCCLRSAISLRPRTKRVLGRLLVYPLIVGAGKALFATVDRRRSLTLRKSEQLPDGRVSLSYALSG